MKVRTFNATELEIRIDSESETELLGRVLAQVVEPGVVIGLVGMLGAGKTRLVRAIAEALGVDERAIASPTFVLIHEYQGRLPIYHFDAYRLADPEAFDALGAADYWADAVGLCLIEWADLVADRLPNSTWWITIDQTDGSERVIRLQSPETSRIEQLLLDLDSSTR